MKKKVVSIILAITIIFSSTLYLYGQGYSFESFLPKSSVAYAVGDLTVNWGPGISEGDPIFTVNNMAPGDVESRTVAVNNGAASSRAVAVKGIKTAETGLLSSAMEIEIKDGGTTLYGPKPLSLFFTESSAPLGIFLLNINSGGTKNIMFQVTFKEESGNEFQNKTLVFDLKIGISLDTPAACNGITFSGDPIIGTKKSEKLKGTPGNDLIMGLEGADEIDGKGGDDCIIGGAGADNMKGGSGNDVLDGNGGADSFDGGDGDDSMFGGEGADDFRGGRGNDTVWGGSGADSMDGGDNNDYLNGESGNDDADGKAGIDTCVAESKKRCEL